MDAGTPIFSRHLSSHSTDARAAICRSKAIHTRSHSLFLSTRARVYQAESNSEKKNWPRSPSGIDFGARQRDQAQEENPKWRRRKTRDCLRRHCSTGTFSRTCIPKAPAKLWAREKQLIVFLLELITTSMAVVVVSLRAKSMTIITPESVASRSSRCARGKNRNRDPRRRGVPISVPHCCWKIVQFPRRLTAVAQRVKSAQAAQETLRLRAAGAPILSLFSQKHRHIWIRRRLHHPLFFRLLRFAILLCNGIMRISKTRLLSIFLFNNSRRQVHLVFFFSSRIKILRCNSSLIVRIMFVKSCFRMFKTLLHRCCIIIRILTESSLRRRRNFLLLEIRLWSRPAATTTILIQTNLLLGALTRCQKPTPQHVLNRYGHIITRTPTSCCSNNNNRLQKKNAKEQQDPCHMMFTTTMAHAAIVGASLIWII